MNTSDDQPQELGQIQVDAVGKMAVEEKREGAEEKRQGNERIRASGELKRRGEEVDRKFNKNLTARWPESSGSLWNFFGKKQKATELSAENTESGCGETRGSGSSSGDGRSRKEEG